MTRSTMMFFTILLVCSISAQAQTAIELDDRATTIAMNGNFEDAIILYNKAIELNPDYAEAYQSQSWFELFSP